MKKILSIFVALVATISSFAADFTVDGIAYNITDATKRTVTVISKSPEYSGTVVIPATVTYGGDMYSVTSIGSEAFENCTGLTSVTIPNSVKSIGSRAFENCTGLKSITIPNSVKSIGSRAFRACSGLTSITIPNSVTSIGNSAFSFCSSLTSITIPDSVTSIEDFAFSYCSGLTSITIPNSLTECGSGIISYDYALDTIISPDVVFNSIPSDDLISQPNAVSFIEITGGELTNDGFTMIRRQYKTLKTLKWDAIENTTLSDEAIKGCYNLDSLTLPSQLVSVAYSAVAECMNLKTILIPENVLSLEARAFENCRSLNKVEFAENSQLQSVGNWCFYNCHELKNLILPEGVTEIGLAAFYGCSHLDSIQIPASMSRMADNSFAGCVKMRSMKVEAVIPPTIDSKTFEDVNRSIPVYVPYGSKTSYENDPYWQEFFNIIEYNAPSAVTNVNGTTDTAVQKVLHNGHLYLLRSGKTYTIQGAEVKAPL